MGQVGALYRASVWRLTWTLQALQDGRTALMDAADDGAAAIARELLDRKADANAQDRVSGRQRAQLAASRVCATHLSIRPRVELGLLRCFVCDPLYAQFGNSPLLLAVAGGHVGACRLLLDHGADPCVGNKVRGLC